MEKVVRSFLAMKAQCGILCKDNENFTVIRCYMKSEGRSLNSLAPGLILFGCFTELLGFRGRRE